MFSVARAPARSLKRSGLETQQAHWGVIFALPAILGFLIFTLGPMLASLVLSFTDYKPISTKISFVGLQNYLTLFKGGDFFFYKSLRVTIYYVILSVPLAIVVSFLMAMVLNKNIVAKGFFRSVFYLPTMVPIVATAMIWTWLLDPDMGLLNETLRMVGLPTSKWIYAENTAVPSFAIINLWNSGWYHDHLPGRAAGCAAHAL
jgi:multiple sugar transport system permease protein